MTTSDETFITAMRHPPMIRSLLETDMYKFSMGQTIYHQFSDYMARWAFKCRNENVTFTAEMVEEIRQQILAYCDLYFKDEELEYLAKIPWIKPSYVEFLRFWHPRFKDISIRKTDTGCGLEIETFGTWLNTSMYEIPILAIVNETYYRFKYEEEYSSLQSSFMYKLKEKVEWLKMHDIGTFSEFGLRRRFSGEMQDEAVLMLNKYAPTWPRSKFVGTSNVYLAKKHGLTPVGTMAHEFLQCVGQGNPRLNPAYSNHFAMEAWVKEFMTRNGTMLSDCIGTDVFLRDFDLTYATLFSGVRHDSGDPFVWGEKIIQHYEKLGIDPKTKTLLFSDSLNFEKAGRLYEAFHNRTKVAFGIGTYLANNTRVPPLNIVCKVIECNGLPTAKLSDSAGKCMCRDEEYVKYLKRTIDWRLTHERK